MLFCLESLCLLMCFIVQIRTNALPNRDGVIRWPIPANYFISWMTNVYLYRAQLSTQRFVSHYFLICQFVTNLGDQFCVRLEKYKTHITVIFCSGHDLLISGKIRPRTFLQSRKLLSTRPLETARSIQVVLDFCNHFDSVHSGVASTCLGFSLLMLNAFTSGSPFQTTGLLRLIWSLKHDPVVLYASLHMLYWHYFQPLPTLFGYLHYRIFPIRYLEGSQRSSLALSIFCLAILILFFALPSIAYASACNMHNAFLPMVCGIIMGSSIKLSGPPPFWGAVASEISILLCGIWSYSIRHGLALAMQYNICRSLLSPAFWYYAWHIIHPRFRNGFYDDCAILVVTFLATCGVVHCPGSLFEGYFSYYDVHAILVLVCCLLVPQNLGRGPDSLPYVEVGLSVLITKIL